MKVKTALALFVASFTLRFLAFIQTPFANGWDGYFYVNQVRSFLEEGKMDVPDISLIYPLMMIVQVFTQDYILSYKILAAILAGSFTVSVFLLALKWNKNYDVSLLLGCLSLFSPHLTYFAAQYPKNLLGAVLFIWLLYVSDPQRRIAPIALLVLNFFGHRVTTVLGVVFLSIRRFNPYALIVFFVLLAAGGFFLPGVLHFLDVERFRGVISSGLQFAPYSFFKSFGVDLISPWWMFEIVIGCVLFFVAIAFVVKKYDQQLTSLLFVLAILIFPFFVWSNDGPAIRFFFIFILLCPLLLIFILKSTPRVLTIAVAICSLFSFRSYDPARHDPPYGLYNILATQVTSNVPADCELIIAHKSLAEYIVYSTGIDAMSWIPEYEIEPARLWRVAEGVKDVQLGFYLAPEDLTLIHRLSPSYVLLQEDRWQKFLKHVKDDGNEELLQQLATWKNPTNTRPKYLLRLRDKS